MTEPWEDDAAPVGEAEGRREAADFAGAQASGGAVAESMGLYQLLVDSVQDYAIFALDPDGNVLSWNAGAQRLKGYTRDEIVGRHFSSFYPPEDAAKPAWELEVAKREGRVEDEGWRVRKDGTRFWANVVITALRDESGTLVGFAKVTRDLTQRRSAEESLRESEERFRLLVHSVRDYAIFMLDPEGVVSSWNEGAQRIKGYRADEIIGRHFSTFYPPEDLAKPPWELEVAKREGRVEDEGWRVRKDGTRFWANVVITALRDPKGTLIGFTKVTRDLTERRRSELEAVEAARRVAEAEAANRAKSDFLAAMSHELRTPLNAIGGYVELMAMGLGGTVTEEQRGYLEKVQRSQRHLLQIISDLLNFSRIEAGQIEYDIGPVALRESIATVATMLEPQVAEKEIALVLGPCTAGLAALADRVKVEQIILNLCSNAVKFTEPGGRVEVSCTEGGGRVAVAVSDTGVGIAPEDTERVFEPFVQLGRGLTTRQEGTGLGLAISRDLARAMGGDLTVHSEEGKGSTFTLILPPAPDPAEEKAADLTPSRGIAERTAGDPIE
ncbi:MAG TPA: PAS domain-containing sensor histidine kinase [Longimicrobium sp.]|nr:PAS domain-containing sensor histidine kinase [Longimicrobium sp.]